MPTIKPLNARWLLWLPALFLVSGKAPDAVQLSPVAVDSDQALAKLQHKEMLSALTLEGTVSDAGMSNLKGMSALTNLVIRSDRISDAGVKNIESLPKLSNLHVFGGAKITDETAKIASQKPSIYILGLQGPNLTDKTITYASDLPNLQSLSIERAKLTGATLSSLSKLHRLRTLDLDSNQIHGSMLASISSLPIACLNLNDNPLTDAAIPPITKLKLVGSLNLENAQLTAAAVPQLAHLTRLTSMSLAHNQIGKATLSSLRSNPSLSQLRLSECGLDNNSLKQIGTLKQLWGLDLSNNPRTNETQSGSGLSLRNKFNDNGMFNLKDMKNLHQLNLSYNNLSPHVLRLLQSELPRCRFTVTIFQDGRPD